MTSNSYLIRQSKFTIDLKNLTIKFGFSFVSRTNFLNYIFEFKSSIGDAGAPIFNYVNEKRKFIDKKELKIFNILYCIADKDVIRVSTSYGLRTEMIRKFYLFPLWKRFRTSGIPERFPERCFSVNRKFPGRCSGKRWRHLKRM